MTGGQLYVKLELPEVVKWSESTREFWDEQDQLVRAEALDPSPERVSRRAAAQLLDAVARRVTVGDRAPIFVASPAGFDWSWIDDLLQAKLGQNAFGYAPLCVRSMSMGMHNRPWSETFSGSGFAPTRPDIPHHPLSDAIAEAKTFIDLLALRPQRAPWAAHGAS